jgi:hypothetical protein
MTNKRITLSDRVNLAAATGFCVLSSVAFAASPNFGSPKITQDVAHDVSQPLGALASAAAQNRAQQNRAQSRGESTGLAGDPVVEAQTDRAGPQVGPTPSGNAVDNAIQRNGARQTESFGRPQADSALLGPFASFDGLSNDDNFNIFGFRVNPPDPAGAVGPNHYVQMLNLVFAVYDKTGNQLTPAAAIGDLWAGFAVADCADSSGDPIVVYDRFADRWILSQFTTAGTGNEFYNCVAVSTTGDPTGTYYRYAFSSGTYFPDYPKYGSWSDTYVITTREFESVNNFTSYGIGIYALEKNKMIRGKPARAISYFLEGVDGNGNVDLTVLPLIGDGLLPAYVDGRRRPRAGQAIPIVGTQDDGGPYGALFDALNIFDLTVRWTNPIQSSLFLNTQLPVASFDSIYPCAPSSRDCLPQPGIVNPSQFLDVLSYRQRPTWRLAYRNFGSYDAMVTAQSVEAAPSQAGMRWYEIRRIGTAYSVYQQGTYAPSDGVHRWMGSISQDKWGNIGLAYSVVDGVSVFPGVRFTGRRAGDPLGLMTLGEGTLVDGTGVQTSTNSRWGDYTSLNPDPVDDCSLWHVNQYYTAAGQASSSVGWQTRIGNFKLSPACVAGE